MILRLAAEQARSQKRYTYWTAALMTLALTLAALSLFGYATQRASDSMSRAASLEDRDNRVGVLSTFDIVAQDVVESTPWDEPSAPAFMPVAEVDMLLDSAILAGTDVTARRSTLVRASHAGHDSAFELSTVTGAFDWGLVVAQGSEPGSGQIALSADLARSLGLSLGDQVDVRSDPDASVPTTLAPRSFTVSGLLHTCSLSGEYNAWCPEAYVAWEESSDPEGLFARQMALGGGSDWHNSAGTTRIVWNAGDPSLGAFAAIRTADISFGSDIPTMAYRAGIFAGLLLIGIVIMAFAVGRAQAQARLQWVATTRTLGATRRAVATATAAEALLMGVTSCVAALGLGYGAAALHFATTRPAVPHPFGPSSVAAPAWVFAIIAGLALVLASIIAVTPAFWAARVPPVAAFKPVADVTEAEASRKVGLVWDLVPLAMSLECLVLVVGMYPKPLIGIVLAGAVAVITGVVALKETLRGVLVRMGRWLSARRAPWAMATGDAFVARPRQAVAPALLFALPVGVYAWALTLTHFLTIDNAASNFNQGWSVSRHAYLVSIWADPEVLRWVATILIVFGIVALALAIAGRDVAVAEDATRRALGLSSTDVRCASFVQHALPPVIGAAVGVVVGGTLAILTHFLTALNWPGEHGGTLAEYSHALLQCAFDSAVLIILAGIVASGLGLLVVATTRRSTPVAALRPASKVTVR
jgi:ABC-type lipoprotein release transport system permease subunit